MNENMAIEAETLSYFYTPQDEAAPRLVLDKLSLSIPQGSFTCVLGHNGSGKSTFARHCNALLLPRGGHVYAFGRDTLDESQTLEIRRRVGMVFQNPDNQIVSNVVEEDVAFAPENLGFPSAEIRRRVDEALKTVGMYEYRTHAPHLLSGGQKQRVAIAGVLAMGPACVVFDEPTAMLDPSGRKEVMTIIRELREAGVTVLLITHHMEEAIHADKVIVLSDGEKAMEGTPTEIFTQVDKLEALGLTAPDTVKILRAMGLPLDALTVEACADRLAEMELKP